ncbi:MAG TPA: hypothetical protein VG052_08280 [Puia sp.]|jgi:ketosteroid isomerase-like protein|nr:hypothetical protein [Puia sp.]
MKKLSFHSSTLLLFSALIVFFCFAGRPINSSPGRPVGHTDTGTDTIGDDIAKIQEQFKNAFITGDSVLFLKGYTQDACVLAPNAPALCGQRGISQFFKNTRQAGIRNAMFTDLGLFGQTAEYVTQQGAFEVFDVAQHSLAKGKVLIIFKKTDEGWRVFRQSLNFDAPPPAPSAK